MDVVRVIYAALNDHGIKVLLAGYYTNTMHELPERHECYSRVGSTPFPS